MSLTAILTNKDLTPAEKLTQVTDIVGGARKAYGNSDATIEAPMTDTTEGRMSFVHLEAEGKVQLLRKQVSLIKAVAVEFVEQNPGASMDRKIEELVATNAYLVNVGNSTEFNYI